MQTFKKVGEGFLIAGFVFLFTILLFESRLSVPAFLKIGGRMHPMFLHFPIVLLLLSFLSLWIPSHEQSVWNWFDGLRLIAAISAVITAIMGLLLSLEEAELTRTLQYHKWGGVGVAVMGMIFYVFSAFFINKKWIGKSFTVLAGLLIFLTGHWGAGLTHGDNYLLEPMASDRKVKVEEAVVFNDIIKPILETKCLNCHKESNSKGGLLMDNIDGLRKGGKTGPLFVPGKPDMSLLMYRIHLPVNEKKHMPPASKPALTEEEAGLLYAWIKSGALLKEKLVSLPAQDSFRLLATRTLQTGDDDAAPQMYDFPAADNHLIATLNNNYRVIKPLGAGAAALAVHFYGVASYSSKALQELLPLKQQVTELSLSRMPVKDEDLKTISQFTNVNKLNLNYTDITGSGLHHLKTLKKLQQLSLSGTKIRAAALEQTDSLPALTKLFIWDTPIDSAALPALQKKFPRLKIEQGFQVDKALKIALSPPTFRTPSGVIQKLTNIELKHPIRGVEIRYTTDGSEPDSIKSEIYKKPFAIDSTVTIKARAFKEGWHGSKQVAGTYLMRKLKSDSIELLTKADRSFALRTKDQLEDGDLGEINYNTGGWLGYHFEDAVMVLHFKKAVQVEKVLMNILRNTGPHVFPPAKIEIWGGMEKEGMKLLAVNRPPVTVKDAPAQLIQEQVSFPATSVRYLKINLERLKALPSWHDSKGKPAWVFISEVVLN